MRKIWFYLRQHLKEDFKAGHYVTIFVILAVAIAFNYAFDFEDNILSYLPPLKKLVSYLAMYGVLYFLAISSYCYFYKKPIYKNPTFWLYSGFGLLVLAFDSSAPFLPYIVNQLPIKLFFWGYKVLVNFQSLLTVLAPILVFYYLKDKEASHAYGLTETRFDARPYLTLIAIMLPLLIMASFHESFLKQYPMYKGSAADEYLGVNEVVTVGIYELFYGLDFITVELLFRGFFVIGLARFLGRSAVLPMAVVYCSLHFGKPMGEAISSIFGGYILGVVAFETRSIWGGIMVHLGIAWLMELIAFLQKL
jgi:hypothetical protein